MGGERGCGMRQCPRGMLCVTQVETCFLETVIQECGSTLERGVGEAE